jgi:Zn-dependent M28 family amino/carboxypeptidase
MTDQVDQNTIASLIGKKFGYSSKNSGNKFEYTLKSIARTTEKFSVNQVIDDTEGSETEGQLVFRTTHYERIEKIN